MGHRIIIGNDEYEESSEPKPDTVVSIDYAPPDGLSLAEEVELFREKMRAYRKAIGMTEP